MHKTSLEQIIFALQEVGVSEGDGLLIHSAIQFLGQPVGGVGIYLQALASLLGIPLTFSPDSREQPKTQTGTLAVPAFNFGFARGESFDPQNTPSQGMGVFSEYIRQHPAARRTPHPMQSLAVIGRYAEDLVGRDTSSAFDPGSAFERMLKLDFDILLLGADIQAVSLYHYCEQRARVPYRFWKKFTGQVRTSNGWESRTYRMFARDLVVNPHIDLHPIQRLLESRQQWWSVPLGYGCITRCRMLDFSAASDELLERDPWLLVTNR
jgi:aminoglycoside N3'-acetyltransferase